MTRGEIWWADCGIPFGSEPGFHHPVLIVQDDAFNQSRINTIVVIPLTTNLPLKNAPGNVLIEKEKSGLSMDSVFVVSQVYAIDRKRLLEKSGIIPKQIRDEVESGLKMVLGME